MATTLTDGTAVVAATGVLFDLWVSIFMGITPNEHIVRIVTSIFVAALLYGLWLMYNGYKTDRSGGEF